MGQTKINIPAKHLAQYDALIAAHPQLERKGKTTPYTSVNGHMFSFLSKNGSMALRLSKADLVQFIELHQTQLMEQHGRVMKDFVQVPSKVLADQAESSSWLLKSFAHTSGLKPKPSKKK